MRHSFMSIVTGLMVALGLQGCSLTPPDPNVLLPAAVIVGAYKLHEHNRKTTYYRPDYYQTSQLGQSSDAGETYYVEQMRCQKTPSACDTTSARQSFQNSGKRLSSEKDVNDMFEPVSF